MNAIIAQRYRWEMQNVDVNRLFFLRIALIVIGLIFTFGIYTFSVLWPSGWGHGY
jgi:hypothetical protein